MSDTITTPTSRRPLGRLISLVLCVALLGVACWLVWPRGESPAATMAGPPTAGPIPVQVEEVQPVTVPVTLEYLGQTEAFQKVDVRARVAAFLEKRQFEEGAMVKEGQELFLLERASFEADVEAAKAAQAQAEARYDQAQRDMKRFEDLAANDATTQQELEDSQKNVKVMMADCQAAKARLRQAELNLTYTVIHSPLTGMVGKTNKDVGSYLSPQTDGPLVLVQQVDPLYIEFPITERDLLRWRELSDGSPHAELAVQLTLPDGNRYPHEGRVNFVDISVAPRTGTALIRAKLDNPDGVLRPGQLLRVKVLGLARKNVLTVAQQAVIQTAAGAIVFIVGPNDVVQPVPVVLGDWVGDRWVIEQGLQPGNRVIVDHMIQMRPGATVKPTVVAATPIAAPAAPKATKTAATPTAAPKASKTASPAATPTAVPADSSAPAKEGSVGYAC